MSNQEKYTREVIDQPFDRSRIDPLEVADADTLLREQIIANSDRQTERALANGDIRKAIDYSVDSLYRALPSEQFQKKLARIQQTESLIERRLNNRLSPLERLEMKMRQIDLIGLKVFSGYQAISPTASPDARQKAGAILQATTLNQIAAGVNELVNAQQTHEQLSDEKAKSDMRGKMFELLFTTNERRKLYDEERYDQEVVVASSNFEDAPQISFTPNHNYDVISFGPDGYTQSLWQCKNGRSSKAYEVPIKVVEGRSFIKFMEDPSPFINAIGILCSNSPNVSENAMRRAKSTIESLFAERPDPSAPAGHLAVSAAR